MNSAPLALTGLLILLLGGCQQSTNPAIPLSPISPLGANTRVPPPTTGSYAVPDTYYQGQASVSPRIPGIPDQYAVGGMAASELAPVQSQPAQATVPPAARATAQAVPAQGTALTGWSNSSDGSAAAVQPAAHQIDSRVAAVRHVNDSAPRAGSTSAPRIPASALPQSAAGETPLRPNFGGMDVVDLTSPDTLQPSDPPSLQVIDPAQFRAASNAERSAAAPSFRSLSPAAAGNPAAGNPAVGNPAVASPANPQEAPSTSQPPSDSETAELPWRKPARWGG